MPYLLTALKPYDVPELSEETDVSNVISEEEDLEEKEAEIDTEALIDDYLEALKDLPSGPKGLEFESGYPRIKNEFQIFEDCKKSANAGCKEKVSIKREGGRDQHEETIYYQKSVGDADIGHMIGVIEPRVGNNIKTEKEILIEYQESYKVDACAGTKLDKKEEVEDKEDLEESDCKALVEGNGRTNEPNNEYKLEAPLEGEVLHRVCVE
ncbi:hypothetical protein C2G38_2028942 [Gigaspora rosea]|uniref:Uncharacterized protein n=1 Tax=Gigaspora rosea TaxID=44941 RepID=A0A397W1E7_9GLOM|nr:hypothetical protein C2G38_2028942 [Gigaspora rosea]